MGGEALVGDVTCLLLAIAVEHLGAAVEGSSGVLTAQALDSDVGQATGYAPVLR